MGSIKSITADEHQAGIIIYEMLHLQDKQNEEFFKGRDFLIRNVEKASAWPDIML